LAHSQSADEIVCDQIAADPADPDKPADIRGVAAVAPADIAKAIKFCRIASARSRRAMYQLGRAYAANQQTPDAITAWRKAADKGSTSAMVELGVLLATGAGGQRDPAKSKEMAQELFTRAAEAGNPRGVLNLLALAANGGPPFDPAQARALLARAAQSGAAEAEFQLGVMLANGTGGRRTTRERGPCSRRQRRRTIPRRCNGWACSRRAGEGARRIPPPPSPTTSALPRSATPTPRLRSSGSTVPTCSRTRPARS
jgi:hypothetical protein